MELHYSFQSVYTMCQHQRNKYPPHSINILKRRDLISDMMIGPIGQKVESTMGKEEKKIQIESSRKSLDYIGLIALACVMLITFCTCPSDWTSTISKVSIQHVWYYGWITAISTGFGVFPFIFISEPSRYWMGISNGMPRTLRHNIDFQLNVDHQSISLRSNTYGLLITNLLCMNYVGLAGGMMLAASYSLTYEGITFTDQQRKIAGIFCICSNAYCFDISF